MASKRQIEANRRNAQKSTGPKSPEGKAVSSMNALKTGLHARSEVLPSESPAQYQELIARYYADHKPATALACQYVDEIIYCTWNLRRLRRVESELYDFVHGDCYEPDDDYPLGQACAKNPKVFSQLQWRMDANRRALDKAVKSLREVQAAEREAASAPPTPVTETIEAPSPEIGSVPNTTSEPAVAPAAPLDRRGGLTPVPVSSHTPNDRRWEHETIPSNSGPERSTC
jgi:hypothetical protein